MRPTSRACLGPPWHLAQSPDSPVSRQTPIDADCLGTGVPTRDSAREAVVPLWYRMHRPLRPGRPRTWTYRAIWTLTDTSTLGVARLGAERSPVQIRPPRLQEGPLLKRGFQHIDSLDDWLLGRFRRRQARAPGPSIARALRRGGSHPLPRRRGPLRQALDRGRGAPGPESVWRQDPPGRSRQPADPR